MRIVHQTPSTATLDGDRGLGLVVAPKAMQVAMEKAEAVGSGWVSVRNSNHFGIAGYHAMLPLKKNMIGMALTNASPLVAPTFARERMLGTNPIAIGIPAGEEQPIVVDMATTTVANGKLEILNRQSRPAPEGWVQYADGTPSTDPQALKSGGALLPLGGDRLHGGHKGYCMGAVVDIWSAVLSGAGYGPWAPPFVSFLPLPENPPGEGLGHFLGAMRVDGFRPLTDYQQHIDNWIRRFRATQPAEGHERVLIPGDPERASEAERRQSGIPLLPPVVEDLREVGKALGVAFADA